jgi:hypothetical protein
MSITISCSCGKPLRAPDQLAGRRVKCPACNRSLSIPGAAAASIGVDAPTPRPGQTLPRDIVHFRCACGKGMRALAIYAGRLARCSACGENVIIPGPDGNAVRRFPADTKTPVPRKPSPPPDEEDDIPEAEALSDVEEIEQVEEADEPEEVEAADEEPEERPVKRRPKKKNKGGESHILLWICLTLFLLLSIGACAAGIWWLMNSANSDANSPMSPAPMVAPAAPTQQPAPAVPTPPPAKKAAPAGGRRR